MTINNFNWFLHAMMFLHTQRVIQKLEAKENKNKCEEHEDEDDEEGIEIEVE
jgi:hypothetical protein